ncbi:MAG: hypothetical protein KC931_00895 [Candidatus Omnitrophica bacterium]|nr:hypothetical protein [Candidatus Omnitrophota bacterium]
MERQNSFPPWKWIVALAIVAGLALLAYNLLPTKPIIQTEVLYRVIDLSEIGGKKTKAIAYNGIGDLVGEYEKLDGTKGAFLWNEKDGFQDLGDFGGSLSRANAIDDNRWIVGYSQDSTNREKAFQWTEETGMVELGDLGGDISRAYTITPGDGILGESTTKGVAKSHAFIWNASEGMVDLGTLGGDFSSASVMNSHGYIVGNSFPKGGVCHGVIWNPSREISDLGSLGPNLASWAWTINTHHWISGSVEYERNKANAALWDASGEIHVIGSLGGASSDFCCVTDELIAVGWSETGHGFQSRILLKGLEYFGDITGKRLLDRTPHGFLYDWNTGRGYDLNHLIAEDAGWVINKAVGINSAGKILAEGSHLGKQKTCFLEPLSPLSD